MIVEQLPLLLFISGVAKSVNGSVDCDETRAPDNERVTMNEHYQQQKKSSLNRTIYKKTVENSNLFSNFVCTINCIMAMDNGDQLNLKCQVGAIYFKTKSEEKKTPCKSR